MRPRLRSEGSSNLHRRSKRRSPRRTLRAKTIRVVEQRANGYEREQFEDAWSRYLPRIAPQNRDTVTTSFQNQESADLNRDTDPFVTVSESGANPHEQRVVTVVTVSEPESRNESLPDCLICERPYVPDGPTALRCRDCREKSAA
jgi:hypothetical protein